MANYKAYPEYKDSGMEWCTALPLGWKRTNLRWLSSIYAGGTPSKNVIDYWENGTIPWINSGAVNQSYVTEPSTFISKAAFENSSAKWIPKGALVVALAGQGKTKGMVAQLGIKTTCNQSMAAIVFYEINLSRYIYWWLTSNYQNIRNMAGGDLRDGLNLELLGDIQCPQPNDGECIRISAFLDHETAKIDNLIEKQQQLIELLKEKRQAVISHAVTKGLNPDVPMKDSGVEWLGEVPEHWDVCAVKHIVSTPITDGPHETPDFIDDGIPFISAEAISSGVIDFDKKRACISLKDHKRFSMKYSPQYNDIYMVKSGATTGITAIVETHDDFNIWSPLAVIRCNEYSNPYFVINFMRSKPFQTAIELN
ncbi:MULTISPECIES: restriction endonuclease subunit S [unclassified Enterobacter]|uniref:restriction endonuclease subunit S n=1 Tax=unclassified Enterobacter TaxID=2608935 RepID=UPI001CBB018F|nr:MULTISPECIES: restriction endonuclease subunit S [unclassified Enterobacter]UXP23537.1 restriction endonuclease subunit S [Enterobacter sp. 155105]